MGVPRRVIIGLTIVRQVIRAGGVLLVVSLLTFALCDAVPGDPLAEMRLNPQISSAALDTARSKLRLDRPFVERYALWLRSVATGDLGFSAAYNTPVAPLIARRVMNSLILTGAALAATWLFAVPFGVWLAARARRLDGRLMTAGVATLHAMPDLLIAAVLLQFAAASGVFPTGGLRSTGANDMTVAAALADRVRHLALPVLAIVLSAAPTIVRHVRAALIDVLGAPYLVAAAAKGVPYRRLLFRSALRAAANPLIALFGLSVATLFSASLVVEVVMTWPGLGALLVEAVRSRDVHLVLAGVLCATSLQILGTAFTEVALRLADPRISV